jgi:hypothetical protein
MDPTPEQLAPIEAQFNSHPAIQAFLQSGNFNVLGWMRAVGQAARDLGIQVPHDYQPAIRDGRVTLQKKDFIARNGWVLPAIAVGAPLAAGAALGAFGGAAAGGFVGPELAGSGNAALGTTATTGLAGSGFGTGAGLGITAAPTAPILAGGAAAAADTAPILSGAAPASSAGTTPFTGPLLEDAGWSAPGAGGTGLASRLLTRDNILTGANIAGGALTAAAQNSRDKELNQIRRDALQLDRDKYALDAPEHRLDTSVHASRILNHTPVTAHWGGPGSGLRGETVKFSGGAANPNLIDPRTRDLSDDVINQQLQDQMQHADDLNPNDPEAVRRRRMAAPGSLPPSGDPAIPRRY